MFLLFLKLELSLILYRIFLKFQIQKIKIYSSFFDTIIKSAFYSKKHKRKLKIYFTPKTLKYQNLEVKLLSLQQNL